MFPTMWPDEMQCVVAVFRSISSHLIKFDGEIEHLAFWFDFFLYLFEFHVRFNIQEGKNALEECCPIVIRVENHNIGGEAATIDRLIVYTTQ